MTAAVLLVDDSTLPNPWNIRSWNNTKGCAPGVQEGFKETEIEAADVKAGDEHYW